MFNNILQDLGTLNQKVEYTIVFPYSDIKIKRIVASCDCTRAYDKASKNELVIVYTPKAAPRHLQEANSYPIKKTIDVYYRRPFSSIEEKITIGFTATVLKAK